jgi:hypothetical protein
MLFRLRVLFEELVIFDNGSNADVDLRFGV